VTWVRFGLNAAEEMRTQLAIALDQGDGIQRFSIGFSQKRLQQLGLVLPQRLKLSHSVHLLARLTARVDMGHPRVRDGSKPEHNPSQFYNATGFEYRMITVTANPLVEVGPFRSVNFSLIVGFFSN
jgi:hypothetical protein